MSFSITYCLWSNTIKSSRLTASFQAMSRILCGPV